MIKLPNLAEGTTAAMLSAHVKSKPEVLTCSYEAPMKLRLGKARLIILDSRDKF
jgi:hypothetical protein